MKAHGLIILLILFIFPACQGFQVKRSIENTLLTSSYPKINIEVSPEFTYEDHSTDEGQFRELGFEIVIPADYENETYIFAQDCSTKVLVIQISQIDGHYYIPQDFYRRSHSSMLMYGEIKIDRESYNHGVWLLPYDNDDLLMVYQLRKCYSQQAATDVFCIEPLSSYTNKEFDWSKPKSLTEEQRVIVKKFVDESRKKFKIWK